ncbi:MAG: metallophosphoesterase family protein [Thermomicrobiales bacterium]
MKLAILSDVHDNVWNLRAALGALGECEALLYCGDLCSPFVIGLLGEGFAGKPIHVVFGNNDGDLFRIAGNAARQEQITLHGELFQGSSTGSGSRSTTTPTSRSPSPQPGSTIWSATATTTSLRSSARGAP